MALKYKSTERFLKPDPVYNSKLVSKFIGSLMKHGERSVAEKIFYEALKIIEGKIADKGPDEVFEQALGNVKPVIEVRSRRVGGMTYQVPTEVNPQRQVSLAIRWILEAANGVKGRPTHTALANELMDAYNKQGSAFTRRENTHRMAEANRDFAHFAR